MATRTATDRDELRRWAAACPTGTLVPLLDLFRALVPRGTQTPQGTATDLPTGQVRPDAAHPGGALTVPWRERLWTCAPEVRVGVAELVEAVGRPKSWVYRHTQAQATQRIPHRRLHGELIFVVGEVREWLRAQEEIIEAGPTDRRLRAVP